MSRTYRQLLISLIVLSSLGPIAAVHAAGQGEICGWGQQKTPNAPLTNITKIAAGTYYSLVLKSDGSIVSWGSNYYGEATPPAGNDFTAIAAGEVHSLALKSDGSIVCWGNNDYGQATPPAGNNFIAIAAGYDYSLALKSDGSIVGWGKNGYGQATPPAGNNFVAIAAGWYHSLALKSDGSIVSWGSNYSGEATPPAGNNFTAIAAGNGHSLALKSDGSIVGWGYDLFGAATPPAGNNFTAIATGGKHCLALKSDGSIVGWEENTYGQATPPAGNNFTAIAAGEYYSLALKSDGSIVGWGDNRYGQATPPAGNNFTAIVAGYYHSLAMKSDGSIVGWGDNEYGQATPPAGNNFVAIAAGVYHSLALKSDGSIVGWGANWAGQATPPAGNNFTAIAASLALKSDGSIVGWGDNEYGQATPPAGNDFVAIVAGSEYSLAIKKSGCQFVLAGDINNDCKVEFGDLTILGNQWLQSPGTPSADIEPSPNGNDIVNFADFATMAENWLINCDANPSNSACVMVGSELIPPTNISAADGAYTDKVTITWTASSGATAYDIYRNASNNSASSVKINTSDVTVTSYNDTSAVAGTPHWYWVKAKNTGGSSDFSSGDSGYKQLPPPAPTVSVQKCSVTAGNNNLDSISFSGSLNAADGDFMAAMNGNVMVSVDSDLMSSPKTFTFPINAATYKKGKFSSKDPNTSFSLDTENNKFTFAAKK